MVMPQSRACSPSLDTAGGVLSPWCPWDLGMWPWPVGFFQGQGLEAGCELISRTLSCCMLCPFQALISVLQSTDCVCNLFVTPQGMEVGGNIHFQ